MQAESAMALQDDNNSCGVKVVRPHGPICFANAQRLKEGLQQLVVRLPLPLHIHPLHGSGTVCWNRL